MLGRRRELMRVLALVILGFALPASAQVGNRTGAATTRDLQRLQDAMANLDEALAALDPADEGTREFRQRADEISEDLVWLKVEIRRQQRGGRGGLGATRDEVDAIRRDMADLQRNIEDAHDGGRRGQSRDVTLPEGTEIQVRLEDSLSSATARVEDRVEATVAAPLRERGRVVLPAGTRVRGVVREVERAQRPARGGKLDLAFDTIYLDDRTRTRLNARVVSLRESMDRGEKAEKAGIGAVLGGVLGTILGGKKGAIIGVVVGGTGGVAASKGEDVSLPAGTIVTLSLERPLTVSLE
jgi:hypothetical protein